MFDCVHPPYATSERSPHRRIPFVFGFAVVAVLCQAYPVRGSDPAPVMPATLDLPAAIRLAYAHNPSLNNARERLVEQAGAMTATSSAQLPAFNAFGLYQHEDNTRIGNFGGGSPADADYWRAGVQVTQPLYYGGRLKAATRSQEFQSASLEAQVRANQTRVLTEVHRQFYAALLAREIIAVQRETLQLLEKQLTLARNRFEAGAGPRFDVLQAEVRLANARPPLIRAINNYRTAVDALRTTLGVSFGEQRSPSDIELVGDLTAQPETRDIESALSEALTERPELIALYRQRDAADQDVRRSRAQRAPRINLFANYSIENDRYSEDTSELKGWQAGVEATLTLWEGGRIRGELAQASSRLAQMDWQEDALKLAIELEVRNAFNRAEEAREILDAATRVIAQAEEALRLAENRYGVGAITQLDVLASQLEYTRAKLDRITAVHDYQVAIIELQQAVGRVPGAEFLSVE